MAEQVNQRIENMINELEQMRRTNLYDDEEIREISRKRKELEYRLQRRVKSKEDYANYIAFELTLLQDLALRRKKSKITEKKKDLEYSMAKRLNQVFKTFIFRFANDIEIYFEYIKYCSSTGFQQAISTIIGQMLQIHGEKPKSWQLASKWELKEQNNLESAKNYLLKGIHRHPESEILYLDLFEIELMILFKAESEEEKDKQLQRATIVWKNGLKNTTDLKFLFKLCDLAIKYDVDFIIKEIKKEVWSRRDKKEVWAYIAFKELEGSHWEEIEEFVDNKGNYPELLQNYIAVFEEALEKFPDKKLCTKYIHGLVGLSEMVCNDKQKIKVVKHAWKFGNENGLLEDHMYGFGIDMIKIESDMNEDELAQVLDDAAKMNPQARIIWEEKIILHKDNDEKMLSILKEASLKSDDSIFLWNLVLDHVKSSNTIKNLHKRFQNCESTVILAIKPKLLQKMYEHNGLKATRELYDELIKTPPMQIDVHKTMIDIEKSQDKPNLKNIRKCFEYAVLTHGTESTELWKDYIKFETDNKNVQTVPAIYRRAIAVLKKELVDDFIKIQTFARIK